jgi:hypothetical protein
LDSPVTPDTPDIPEVGEAVVSREQGGPSHLAPEPPVKAKWPTSGPSKPQEGANTDPNPCPGCGVELPQRDSLRFCPHCGTNVLLAPCSECGEILERSWKYCLSCGTSTR